MAARNIMFDEFMPEVSDVLVKALLYAMASGNAGYLMFGTYGERDVATEAENAHATEILQTAIQAQTIFYGSEHLIAYTLRSIADEIENSDCDLTGLVRFKDGLPTHIVLSRQQLVALKSLARSLCPHAEISMSRHVRLNDGYSKVVVTACHDMLEKVVNAAPPSIDYGQNNIGVVVDGVLFDFPRQHPIVGSLIQSMTDVSRV